MNSQDSEEQEIIRWLGFGSDFNNPAAWYFRTLETWTALLQRCGFDILECREPKAVGAVTPASAIWIGKTRRSAQTWRKWSLNDE